MSLSSFFFNKYFIIQSKMNPQYRPEIDGLRAIAVIAVIANHFNKFFLPGGYLGVDIFFVISGYVITSSLYQRKSKNILDFLSGFYERRIKRLIPALAIFITISMIAVSFFKTFNSFLFGTATSALFGVSNIYLATSAVDYFGQIAQENIFTHTWSLGVEEQFYLIFPFLAWFSGFSKKTKNGINNLFFILIFLSVISLINFFYLINIKPYFAYFLMPSRFWEMASGSFIFLLFLKNPNIKYYISKIPSLLILTSIMGLMFLGESFFGFGSLLVVILTCLIFASLKKETLTYKILTNSLIINIGLISYSLYLWHWCIITLSRLTIGIYWWTLPFQIGLIFIISFFSYKYIEVPFRKKQWFTSRNLTFIAGGTIIASTSALALVLAIPLRGLLFIGRKEVPNHLSNYYTEAFPINSSCSIFKDTQKALNIDKSCGSFIDEDLPTVYVLGDSHAFHIGKELNYLSSITKKFNTFIAWGGYCKFPAAVISSVNLEEYSGKKCFDLQLNLENKLVQKSNPRDVLLIASFAIDQFIEIEKNPFIDENSRIIFTNKSGIELSTNEAKKIYFKKVNKIFQKFNQKNVQTYFYMNAGRFLEKIGDDCYSEWKEQWFRPFNKRIEDTCKYPTELQYSKYRKAFDTELNQLINYFSESIIIDAFDTGICNSEYCDGSFLIDRKHLQRWGNAFIAKELIQRSRL